MRTYLFYNTLTRLMGFALIGVFIGNVFAGEVVITVKVKGCAKDGDDCNMGLKVGNQEITVIGKISSPGDYKYCTDGSPGTVGCCGFTTANQNCTYTCSGTLQDAEQTPFSEVVTYVQGKTPTINTGSACD